MKQGMKQIARLNDFVCWCGKALETLSQLRTHQSCACPVTTRNRLRNLHESFEEMEAKRVAQHEADLRQWKKEKARGVPKGV